MRVDYPVTINGTKVTFSEEVETDVAAFEFLFRMDQLYGNLVCSRNGKSSNKVRTKIRTTKDGDPYYELVCYDTDPELNYAKMSLGIHQKDKSLYRKLCEVDGKGKVVKDEDGKTKYLPNNGWMQYNKETGKEE